MSGQENNALNLNAVDSAKADHLLEVRAVNNMILMLAGKLVSLFGSYVYSFAMGLYVLRITGSAMSFAATLIFSMLPRVLLAPFAGTLADRLNRKKMVVVADLASGITMLLLYIATHLYGVQVILIYGAAFLLAVANTFLNVALDAAVPNLVTDRHLVKINSLNQSIISLTQISAPFIGGLIFGLIDIRLFVLINGVSFLASAVSETFIKFGLTASPESAITPVVEPILTQMKAGYVFLRQNTLLFSLGLFAVFLNFCVGTGLGVAVPYIINNVIGLNSTLYGIISALLPAGIFIGSMLISLVPEFRRRYPIVISGLLVMALALTLSGLPALPGLMTLGQTSIFVFYLVLFFTFGFANPFVNIPIFVLMQRQTPDNFRGRVFGLIQTMSMAITPVAYLLAGLLVETLPPWLIPLGAGISMLFVVAIISRNSEFKRI